MLRETCKHGTRWASIAVLFALAWASHGQDTTHDGNWQSCRDALIRLGRSTPVATPLDMSRMLGTDTIWLHGDGVALRGGSEPTRWDLRKPRDLHDCRAVLADTEGLRVAFALGDVVEAEAYAAMLGVVGEPILHARVRIVAGKPRLETLDGQSIATERLEQSSGLTTLVDVSHVDSQQWEPVTTFLNSMDHRAAGRIVADSGIDGSISRALAKSARQVTVLVDRSSVERISAEWGPPIGRVLRAVESDIAREETAEVGRRVVLMGHAEADGRALVEWQARARRGEFRGSHVIAAICASDASAITALREAVLRHGGLSFTGVAEPGLLVDARAVSLAIAVGTRAEPGDDPATWWRASFNAARGLVNELAACSDPKKLLIDRFGAELGRALAELLLRNNQFPTDLPDVLPAEGDKYLRFSFLPAGDGDECRSTGVLHHVAA